MQEIYYSRYNPFGFSGLDVARAVQYVTNVGIEQKKPVSFCLPSGSNTGSHDGTSFFDQVLKIYGQNIGVSIVVPAGEEANKGHHASGNLQEKEEQEVKLMIPKGQGGFVIEIWAGFGDRFEVSLTMPQVEQVLPVVLLNKAQTSSLTGDSFVWSEGSKIDGNTGCQVIRFRLGGPVAGEWIIRIKGIVAIAGQYNIWILRQGIELANTKAMRAILVANVRREPTIIYPSPSVGYGLLDINQPFIIKDVTR